MILVKSILKMSCIFFLLSVFTKCKKEDSLIDKDYYQNQQQKNIKLWYKNIMGHVNKETLKEITFFSIKEKGEPQWEKTIWHEVTNSYITPINIIKKGVNNTFHVNKYLVIQANEKGSIISGNYTYVISKIVSSEKQTSQPNFKFLESNERELNFTGAYISYDFNNNFISSKNYSNGELTNTNDVINIKIRLTTNSNDSNQDASSSVANPNEEGCSFIGIDWYWQTFVNGVLVSEEYVYSTNEWFCPGGGGNPLPPVDTLNTPCKQADTLAMNAEFKSKLEYLKTKTTTTKEYGYYYKNTTSNNIEETEKNGNETDKYIDMTLPAGVQIDGFMHSHFANSLSIFSVADMYSLCKLYTNNKMKDPKKFTAAVVTANGTQYLLKIEDLALFQTFAQANSPSIDPLEFTNKFIYKMNSGNSIEENEKRFLQFIQNGKTGLKLFIGNSTFTNWQPKKIGTNNTVVNAPCN